MKKLLLLSSLLITSLLAGCGSGNVQIAPPVSDTAAGVAIKISSICLALTPCANQTVTFAKLDDNDQIMSTELYPSSASKSNHYYLLNATPGTYVAVAASYARSLNTSGSSGNLSYESSRVFGENILFAEDLVSATRIEVVPGQLAVMGEFDFSIEGRMAFAPSAAQFLKNADSVQAHYAKAMDPDMESRGMTSAIKFYRATLKSTRTDQPSREQLLDTATQHIGADGWHGQILNSSI